MRAFNCVNIFSHNTQNQDESLTSYFSRHIVIYWEKLSLQASGCYSKHTNYPRKLSNRGATAYHHLISQCLFLLAKIMKKCIDFHIIKHEGKIVETFHSRTYATFNHSKTSISKISSRFSFLTFAPHYENNATAHVNKIKFKDSLTTSFFREDNAGKLQWLKEKM